MPTTVTYTFHVTDDGTLQILDQFGKKIKEIQLDVDQLNRQGSEAFGKLGQSVGDAASKMVEMATGSAEAGQAAAGLTESLTAANVVLGVTAGAALAVGSAYAIATANTIKYAQELNDLSRQTGIAATELSKYYVATQA